ncbi:MAG: aspartate kinase [Sphaerochaetaceae bacterium]|nr:aspartate kinase [Sphaerochaetaceae bacterium]
MIKVAKFGGSSVADAAQFKRVKDIVEADSSRRVVVVSAAGKRFSEDHKMTDLLYLCHAHLVYGVSCEPIFRDIERRFCEIRDELGLDINIEADFDDLWEKMDKDMSVDFLVSRGEYFTSRLMASFLGYKFLDASDCIFSDYNGAFDMEKIEAAIKEALQKYHKVVIPGFYSALPSGKIKIMSRGGSDITGALAAAACNADVYENWTDVSGILMADPRIVKNPKPIEKITYAELRELASMGASVLHEESILPVKEKGIPLNIRNTNKPEHPGTMIVETIEKESEKKGRFLTGIAGRKNFEILSLRKHNLDNNSDLRKVLEILENHKIAIEHISLGLDSFSLVFAKSSVESILYDVISEIQKILKPDNIDIQENISLVAAVGRKMTFRPGISGLIFNALGEAKVNIRTIAQGSDELSIVVGVDNSQFDTTVRVLYEGFAG